MQKKKNKRAPFNPNSPKHQSDRNRHIRENFGGYREPSYFMPDPSAKTSSTEGDYENDLRSKQKSKSGAKSLGLMQKVKNFFRRKTA